MPAGNIGDACHDGMPATVFILVMDGTARLTSVTHKLHVSVLISISMDVEPEVVMMDYLNLLKKRARKCSLACFFCCYSPLRSGSRCFSSNPCHTMNMPDWSLPLAMSPYWLLLPTETAD